MSKYLLSAAIFLLSVSIFFFGFQLSNITFNGNHEVANTNLNYDKGLWTIEEAASYLSMSVNELEALIRVQDLERIQRTSYPTYEYIPYIKISDVMYFNKIQLDEWIKHSSMSRLEL